MQFSSRERSEGKRKSKKKRRKFTFENFFLLHRGCGFIESSVMENSSAIRRRVNRNARESTPEPTKLIRVGSDRRVRSVTTDASDVNDDENTVYVVKGVLNVGGNSGAASPTSSISSLSSGSGSSGKPSSGSHAYRAKLLRYYRVNFHPPCGMVTNNR